MKLDPRSLPSTDDIQRTVFQTIQEKRNIIFGGIAIIAIVIIGGIYWMNSIKADEDRVRSALFQATQVNDMPQRVMNLEEAIRETPDDQMAYALLKLAEACSKAAEDTRITTTEAVQYLDRGLEALRKIEQDHADQPWALAASPEDPNVTLVRDLLRKMNEDRKWRLDHEYKPPEVDTTVTALIETNLGNISIGFFPELAPKHVENFIKLAKSGFYNDQMVHSVITGLAIKLGDPNTRNRDDLASHGKGGPGYSLTPEKARFVINHTAGVVSSAIVNEEESGSQFLICLDDRIDLDKKQTPFGKVIDGMDVLEVIEEVPPFALDPTFRAGGRSDVAPDHPSTDIIVYTISIHRDGKIDEGHEWDTSVIGTTRRSEKKDGAGTEDVAGAQELKKRLEALMAEAAELEDAGKLAEALAKVREALVLDPAFSAALDKAAELAEKVGR